MIQFKGALVREGSICFAIVEVPIGILEGIETIKKEKKKYSSFFGDVPIVLCARDGRGRTHFRGKKEIVQFIAGIDTRRIPWKRYTIRGHI